MSALRGSRGRFRRRRGRPDHHGPSRAGGPGGELVPKVFDAELVDDQAPSGRLVVRGRLAGYADRVRPAVAGAVGRAWRSSAVTRARSVAAYRVRSAPRDVVRLLWFVLRGHGRWVVKAWNWTTYGDLRADARAARLAGDPVARRAAQEAIRADARARWGRFAIAVHRMAVSAVVLGVLAVLLKITDAVMDRADMWRWLAAVYELFDAVVWFVRVAGPWLLAAAGAGWLIGAAWEGRDRSPGAGWLVRPDRDDANSWIDERMISRALAHLGISPLSQFFKGGGELVYTVPARKDGNGTAAQIRLPLGVTADMVAARRSKLAANLGRASLETWPTKGSEDGLLDLWVADKGALRGDVGQWPFAETGQVDLFDGVPFGLSQRGNVITAPLIGVNWLIGGRPGQGKTSALRLLMLGAALDPTAELWAFVMGESPDFDPFAPRLTRYRMGMDDAVAADATRALEDLLTEMERRGKTLGEQPGRPPKVSRKLADRKALGLHPLVCAIDECHELFQHPRHGKQAAELAVRLIKRGRKYGVVLLLATQSPTKNSIPREVTRNIACAAAFSVADQVANDGLLGSGKYAAGIRATELRINTDRGTCVTVGTTDETFELTRTFYVAYEDGTDDVTPIVARATQLIADAGRAVHSSARAALESAEAAPVVDFLHDLSAVMGDEARVMTRTILSRLAQLNPDHYEGWTFNDLRAALSAHGIRQAKSHGNKVVRAEDLAAALAGPRAGGWLQEGDNAGDTTGTRGRLPGASLHLCPPGDQGKHAVGAAGTEHPGTAGGACGGQALPGGATSPADSGSGSIP